MSQNASPPRPVMGIGSCLAGNPVRYNGETKRANEHVQALERALKAQLNRLYSLWMEMAVA